MRRRFRTATLALVSLLASLALLELGVRAVFSLRAGHSLLGYGMSSRPVEQPRGALFPRGISRLDWHRILTEDDREKEFLVHAEGPYSRYRPRQYKVTRDEGGRRVEIRINDHGFRGPDFRDTKPPGVYRVLTLGASSTFGYRNADAGTYPVQMQRWLQSALARRRAGAPGACPGVRSFEVINFGIPHLGSAEIRALLAAEGLPLAPDAVTFYEGANDTRLLEAGPAQRWLSTAGERLLSVRFVHFLLRERLSSFDSDDLAEQLEGLPEAFLANVSAMADVSDAGGAAFFVASQQARSNLLSREALDEVSYADEVALVREALAREGRIDLRALVLLMHDALMRALAEWSSTLR